ncbi:MULTISPECIES: hypothetical protein [unclassified Clostridium]|uniref:hypothetical protein n=1 Tax=unclassified Clostridium TaxID=2614128 RepID=UPI0002975216|nr:MULTISPECIES: hypothetical protein [unclassified Clostridium]EKQ57936.1 MAG: hypothetical protein A370_00364 [Clostridium sp. Maddingley MBC34-26]
MDIIIASLILSLIIAGIVYFSVKSFENILKKNIMRYVICLLLIILIIFYILLYLSQYGGYGDIIDTIFIWGVELFLIIFAIIEKLYEKFKA